MYIHAVYLLTITSMASFPHFASPDPPEWRAYYSAIRQWFENGSGSPSEPPDDPLRAFVDATAKTRKRLISIRVDEGLLQLTKELASQHGMPYQAVIRVWIEEGLRRAIREGAEETERAQAPIRVRKGRE
jgi:hypothetical protein